MKPFSPIYFIKENKAKCILLIFMLFLGYGAYLGGLYVSNPLTTFDLPLAYAEDHVRIALLSFDPEDRERLQNEASKIEDVQLIHLGTYQSFTWKSIMGFGSGDCSFTFRSVEDFKVFCEYMDIECDCDGLTSGSMVMSEKFAKNRGLKIGDKVDGEFSESLSDTFTLKALTNEDGYAQYFISDEDDRSTNFILIGKNGKGGRRLYDVAYGLKNDFNIFVHDNMRAEIEEQFETFYVIYTFIVVLLSVILAVTINAAFVGMYQRRHFEFAVYRAIGISRRRMIGKIVGELLCMDLFALAGGGIVFFFGLYLFNELVLYPKGLYLRYFHPLALFGLLLCNFAVIVPLMITRSRQMLKADICEY